MNTNIILISELSTFGRGRDKTKRKAKKELATASKYIGGIGTAGTLAGGIIGGAKLGHTVSKLGNPSHTRLAARIGAARGMGKGALIGAGIGTLAYGASKLKKKKDK